MVHKKLYTLIFLVSFSTAYGMEHKSLIPSLAQMGRPTFGLVTALSTAFLCKPLTQTMSQAASSSTSFSSSNSNFLASPREPKPTKKFIPKFDQARAIFKFLEERCELYNDLSYHLNDVFILINRAIKEADRYAINHLYLPDDVYENFYYEDSESKEEECRDARAATDKLVVKCLKYLDSNRQKRIIIKKHSDMDEESRHAPLRFTQKSTQKEFIVYTKVPSQEMLNLQKKVRVLQNKYLPKMIESLYPQKTIRCFLENYLDCANGINRFTQKAEILIKACKQLDKEHSYLAGKTLKQRIAEVEKEYNFTFPLKTRTAILTPIK